MRQDSIARSTGKKLDRWIIAVLAIAVVLPATNTFVLHRDVTNESVAANTKALAAELAKCRANPSRCCRSTRSSKPIPPMAHGCALCRQTGLPLPPRPPATTAKS